MTDDANATARRALHRLMDTLTFDGRKVPEHTRGGIARYIVDHCQPGDFLEAVLCNDLREAIGRADEMNRANLNAIVFFLYNEAPGACWGSREKYKAWMQPYREG